MFPRLAHSLLRFAFIVSAGIGSACSVYDPSLLAADEASASAAASSIGGSTSAGGSSDAHGGTAPLGAGGSASSGGEGSNGGTTSTSGGTTSMSGGTTSALGGAAGAISTSGGAGGSEGGKAGASSIGGSSSIAGSSSGGSASGGSANGGSGSAGGGASGLDPCQRSNWKATASESSVSTTTPTLNTPPPQAIDGNTTTRWSSGEPQVGGEWFLIDLGAVAPHLTQIALDTSGHPTDYPVSYKLEASSDGASYAFVASGSGSSVTTIKFTDKSARYLKITQTGSSAAWWSIHELSISCQSN